MILHLFNYYNRDDSLKQAIGHILSSILQYLNISRNRAIGINLGEVLMEVLDFVFLSFSGQLLTS